MARKEDENISQGRGLWRRFQDVGGAARCFLQDDAGDIWIGTNSGVSLWDTQEFKDVRLGAEPPIDVFCLLRDSHKNVWAGTDAGLFLFDGKKFGHLGRAEGLLADRRHRSSAFVVCPCPAGSRCLFPSERFRYSGGQPWPDLGRNIHLGVVLL